MGLELFDASRVQQVELIKGPLYFIYFQAHGQWKFTYLQSDFSTFFLNCFCYRHDNFDFLMFFLNLKVRYPDRCTVCKLRSKACTNYGVCNRGEL